MQITFERPFSTDRTKITQRRYPDSFVQSNFTSWVRRNHGKASKCISFERTATGFKAIYEVPPLN